jgi:putative hemolysin
MDTADLWRLGLLGLFLVLSAFFSGSETALVALSRARLTHLVNIRQPGANRVAQLVHRPEKFLAMVLLSNNLVNTAVAVIGTSLVVNMMGNNSTAVVVSTLGVTLVLLIFGETLPKTIAWRQPEKVAFAVSRPLSFVGLLLSPCVRLLQGVSWLVNRLLGISGPAPEIGEQEIRSLIAVGAQAGVVEENEAALLEKVFRFGDRQMREIMTPRPEFVMIDKDMRLDEFLPLYTEHSHTRFPVYEGSMENVVGVLSSKDLLLAMGQGRLLPDYSVTGLLRPAFFVPETKTVSSTFDEMQRGGYGLVLMVDEFGGIAGLATLKQLLEVIVGQVGEEGDTPDQPYTPVDKDTYRLDAGIAVSEINEDLNIGLPEGDYQTVAGFILDHLGRIPEEGEKFEFKDLSLTVKAMSGVRIDTVELRRERGEPDGDG